jgi:hypothetical protein
MGDRAQQTGTSELLNRHRVGDAFEREAKRGTEELLGHVTFD